MRKTTCLIGQRVLKLSAIASVEDPGEFTWVAGDELGETASAAVVGDGGGPSLGVAEHAIANTTTAVRATERRRSGGTGERPELMECRKSKPGPRSANELVSGAHNERRASLPRLPRCAGALVRGRSARFGPRGCAPPATGHEAAGVPLARHLSGAADAQRLRAPEVRGIRPELHAEGLVRDHRRAG